MEKNGSHKKKKSIHGIYTKSIFCFEILCQGLSKLNVDIYRTDVRTSTERVRLQFT